MHKSQTQEIVKIYERPLANGYKSIYLLYSYNKKRYKEKLIGYRLLPETNQKNKAQNKELMKIVEGIKDIRSGEIRENKLTTSTSTNKENIYLLEYIKLKADKELERTKNKKGNYYNYLSLAKHLEAYRGKYIKFGDIDLKFINGFIVYLRNAQNFSTTVNHKILSNNGQLKLLAKFKHILKNIYYEDLSKIDASLYFYKTTEKKATPQQNARVYLSSEEVDKLDSTQCKHKDTKLAFLFSCYSGLRFSDLTRIKWGQIKENEGHKELHLQIKKTEQYQVIPLYSIPLSYLPLKVGNENDLIFNLKNNKDSNLILKKWVKQAGIDKHITFHCARHSAATMMLSDETPIEIVSELLGHKKISTTQLYAKITNKSLNEHMKRVNNINKKLKKSK